LIEAEEYQSDEARNDHRNDIRSLPPLGRRIRKCEGQQENGNTAGEKNNSRNCEVVLVRDFMVLRSGGVLKLTIKLNNEIPNLLRDSSTTLLLLPQALFHSLAKVELKYQVQRCCDNRQNDSKRPKAPTPIYICKETCSSFGARKSCNHVRGRSKRL